MSLTKSDRWILSEFQVARDRVTRLGDKLLYHRQRTPYAEVDLIFEASVRTPDEAPLILMEVKTVVSGVWAREVISNAQRQRLERARWFLELKARRPTLLVLATVEAARDGGPVIRYFDAPF